jgi:hypothetical protein
MTLMLLANLGFAGGGTFTFKSAYAAGSNVLVNARD